MISALALTKLKFMISGLALAELKFMISSLAAASFSVSGAHHCLLELLSVNDVLQVRN